MPEGIHPTPEESPINREYRTGPGIKRFESNLHRFADLLTNMNSFTEDQILKEFAKGGDTTIDSSQTPRDLLQSLVDAGRLHLEFGVYSQG